MKKLVATLLSLIMICSVAVVSFADTVDSEKVEPANATASVNATPTDAPDTNDSAGAYDAYGYDSEGNYNYSKDMRLAGKTNTDAVPLYGQNIQGMYSMQERKVYDLDELPEINYKTVSTVKNKVLDENGIPTGETKDEVVVEESTGTLQDVTSPAVPALEGILLQTYYATRCESCGKAFGADSVYNLYAQKAGRCPHCGEKIPALDDIKVYRFICVFGDENNTDKKNSAHYDIFKYKNFANVINSIFKDTAKDYGDGKDLPQRNLIWEYYTDEVSGSSKMVIVDFKTGFVGIDTTNKDTFKDGFVDRLKLFAYELLYNLQVIRQPLGQSKFYELFSNFQGNAIKSLLQAINSMYERLAAM